MLAVLKNKIYFAQPKLLLKQSFKGSISPYCKVRALFFHLSFYSIADRISNFHLRKWQALKN
jgi:hypothetical protein